jgi:tetratricopeptide (TPR) repeat protein/DNA-binding XRE family transcriptional regulator
MTRDAFASFGTVLKGFRTRRELTQQTLAEKLGVRRNTIGSWERGDFLPQSKTLVLELARHLNLDDEEIRQLLEASLTALAPHWLVPLRRNPYFTGREEILEAMHTQLGFDQTVALTQSSALHGLGGVGKTQIALEYAYRHALDYSAVFWIEAEKDEQIVASLLRIAETLQLPGQNEKDQQQVIAAVQRWLSTHGQWLLIWDNVEDLTLLNRFLPSARSGALLLTTRLQALGALARGLDLLPMEQEEGLLFLLRRANVLLPEATGEQVRQLASQEPLQYAAASELVTLLGGLPLALDQASAYIEETGCSLVDYTVRYQQQYGRLLNRRGIGGGEHPSSVTATFVLASEQVEREHRAAADLLRVCAFLHAEAIPEELFGEGGEHLGPELASLAVDSAQFDEAIAVLRRYSLVQRQGQTRTLSLHRLVQAVLRSRMNEQEQVRWMERVITALNALFPEAAHEVRGQCERLLPHVLEYAASLPDQVAHQEALAEVLRKAADYLRNSAQYGQAELLYQRSLYIFELVLGPEHLSVARLFHNFALLYRIQGKYEQAETLCEKALRIREQALGPMHPDVISSLNMLANFYSEEGKYKQAEPLHQRVLRIREQILEPEHPHLAGSLNNLAMLYTELGKYEQAEPMFHRALAIREHVLGPEHPLVAEPLNNLALLYMELGKYEQAEPMFHRALAIWEQALGPKHPQVAEPLNNLALLYTELGKYEQAGRSGLQALQVSKRALGSEHLEVAYSLNVLANLSVKLGRDRHAEVLYQRALRIREQHRGENHPETALTLYDLALFRQKQGDSGEALSLAKRALQIRSQALGDAHPKTLATRTLSAQLVQEQTNVQGKAASERRPEAIPDPREHEHHEIGGASPLHKAVTPVPPEDDLLQGFLEACCELHPHAWCSSADLWQAYQHWGEERQERYPLSRGAFIAQLKAHGCCADRTMAARIWHGIAVVKKEI